MPTLMKHLLEECRKIRSLTPEEAPIVEGFAMWCDAYLRKRPVKVGIGDDLLIGGVPVQISSAPDAPYQGYGLINSNTPGKPVDPYAIGCPEVAEDGQPAPRVETALDRALQEGPKQYDDSFERQYKHPGTV